MSFKSLLMKKKLITFIVTPNTMCQPVKAECNNKARFCWEKVHNSLVL